METLFDVFERTDRRGTRQTDAFTFLNRVAGPAWSAIRHELEGWFGSYCEDAPPDKARDLRARFRSRDSRQHLGAWWELYTHRLLRALCPDRRIEVEPPLEGIGTRADFVVLDGVTHGLVVESTTTVSGIVSEDRDSPLVASVLDTIDKIQCPEFQVHLDLRKVGKEQPRKREIQKPIEEWLTTLNYQEELAKRNRQRFWERPSERITFRDWEIAVQPIPMSTPIEEKGFIGVGPSVTGYVADSGRIKDAVVRKASRYGSLNVPYVVALAPTSPILHENDVVTGLLGTPTRRYDPDRREAGELFLVKDGALSKGAGAVSGVLTGAAIVPWTVARYAPVLWLNPDAPHPLRECFHEVPCVEFTEAGETVVHEASVSIADLLGLEADWPGDL